MNKLDQTEVHNQLAGQIASQIVRGPLESGGSLTDVLVLAESVMVVVALATIRLGGDEKVLDVMFAATKERLAEVRLKGIKTEGNG